MTDIPTITTEQMVEVDRLMIEEYGITLIQMMENAGRSLAELTRRLLGGSVEGKTVHAVCGMGNNGGGGLVAARHLSNWGASVTVTLVKQPNSFGLVPAHQWTALSRLKAVKRHIYRPESPADLAGAEVILDAIMGYGIRGNPRGSAADLIYAVNTASAPVISLDAPSGLDLTTGIPGEPCIRATMTLTLALPKSSLTSTASRAVIGELYLADIGVPPELYRKIGIEPSHMFSADSIVRIQYS